MVTKYPNRIIHNGKTAVIAKASKGIKCDECGMPINPGEGYFQVTDNRNGIASAIISKGIHYYCVQSYFNLT